MKMIKNRCLQLALFALSLTAVCGAATAADNIVKVADKAGKFRTLLSAARAAGLIHDLQEKGPLTVFAPSDDAFASLPSKMAMDLLRPENKEKLATILKYHVVSAKVAAKDAVQLESAMTLAGEFVRISIRDGRLAVNDANVVINDLEASNGIIHVIDKVLLPPASDIVATAAAASNLKTLVAAVKAAGLVETLQGEGPFTVLAPSDKAFKKLPHGTLESLLKPENKHKLQAILKYHVLSGRRTSRNFAHWSGTRAIDGNFLKYTSRHPLTFNSSKVVQADINASNGVIHIIDSVLMPPATPSTPFDADSSFKVLQRLDPRIASNLKSGHGPQTTATFCNLSTEPIQVYWIDRSGKRKKWRNPIQPGNLEICDRSFGSHVWLVADAHGKELGIYVLDKQDSLIVHN